MPVTSLRSTPTPKGQREKTYPYIGMIQKQYAHGEDGSKDNCDFAILFAGRGRGAVIWAQPNAAHKLGYHHHDWSESQFYEWFGAITITGSE